ncbi:MAG: hypothetical protein SP1CHLAM54_09480 [Chlamydiia bacterium]|nr:hypothetical protein [Chlamydiia bacterium]MCH9615854.1 hypothetical protein [Chlamydiia bacterium]MCH9628743.1 hypothetical protein [Chlamydiia bacterium]
MGCGGAGGGVGQFDVEEAQVGPEAAADGFGDGFFGGKARGVLRRGVFMFIAVSLFGWCVDPVLEVGSEAFEGATDPVDFYDVCSKGHSV